MFQTISPVNSAAPDHQGKAAPDHQGKAMNMSAHHLESDATAVIMLRKLSRRYRIQRARLCKSDNKGVVKTINEDPVYKTGGTVILQYYVVSERSCIYSTVNVRHILHTLKIIWEPEALRKTFPYLLFALLFPLLGPKQGVRV